MPKSKIQDCDAAVKARAEGQKFFIYDKPCARGHNERHANSGRCRKCYNFIAAERRRLKPEENRLYVRNWCHKHPEQRRAIANRSYHKMKAKCQTSMT